MGDGRRGLRSCAASIAETEIPATQFLPTHINRNPIALRRGHRVREGGGGLVDFTTSTVPAFLEEGEVKCSAGLRRMLEAGCDARRSPSPRTGRAACRTSTRRARCVGLGIGRVTSLFAEVRDAVLSERLPLETALAVITSNPARILQAARERCDRGRRRRRPRPARARDAGRPRRHRQGPLVDEGRGTAREGDVRMHGASVGRTRTDDRARSACFGTCTCPTRSWS